MTDRQIIVVTLIAVPIAILAAVGFIFRDTLFPPSPSTATNTRATTAATNPINRVVRQPDSAPATIPNTLAVQREAAPAATKSPTQLRASDEQAKASVRPTVQAPSSPPNSTPAQPTIDEFDAFADSFVKQFALKREAEDKKTHEQDPEYFGRKMKRTYKASLVSTDLKRTDSIAYPIVGVLKVSEVRTTDSTDPNLIFYHLHELVFTIDFAKVRGKWKPVKILLKNEIERSVPENEFTKSTQGQENEWPPESLREVAEAAQQG